MAVLRVEAARLVDQRRADPHGIHHHHRGVDDAVRLRVAPVRCELVDVDLRVDDIHGYWSSHTSA
jgi:hypothetical protein